MSKIINNVDLDKVAETTESGKKEKFTLRKPARCAIIFHCDRALYHHRQFNRGNDQCENPFHYGECKGAKFRS